MRDFTNDNMRMFFSLKDKVKTNKLDNYQLTPISLYKSVRKFSSHTKRTLNCISIESLNCSSQLLLCQIFFFVSECNLFIKTTVYRIGMDYCCVGGLNPFHRSYHEDSNLLKTQVLAYFRIATLVTIECQDLPRILRQLIQCQKFVSLRTTWHPAILIQKRAK